MRIYFLIFAGLFLSIKIMAQTGIGTTTPVNKFEVVTSTAEPATSGSSTNGHLRIGPSSGIHVLDFGLSSSSTYGWLQARSRSDYSTNYHFLLNPNGGRVGLGTFSPTSLLTVGNATGSNSGEITINPQATTNEGGQITFRKSLSGGTTDWTIDHYGDNNTNARFRIFSGGDELSGIILKENGFIGLGTTNPTARLNVSNGGIKIHNGFSNNTIRPSLTGSTIGNYEIRGVGSITGSSQEDGGDDGFLRLSAGGGTSTSAQSSIDISGFSTQGDMDNNIVMRTRGSERLRINNEGRVGIGTNSPAAYLHVASSINQSVGSYGFLNTAGAGAGTYNVIVPYSIQADQRIRAPEFNAISDVRIKKDISKLNTASQLTELNKLRPVNYAYIDQLVNGNKQKTGFIAQEVEQVNPQFVNQSTDFIPSVFALAKSASVNKDQLILTTEKPHGFATGDVVKFFAEGKKEVISTIETIIDSHAFTITGWREPVENVFIYGKKVNDFRAIDFDQITALSVAAIQELSKQMEKLKLENLKLELYQKKLDERLKNLESKIQ